MTHRTEAVFDEEMAPIIEQLFTIAEREGIPLFVGAAIFLTRAAGDPASGVAIRYTVPLSAEPALQRVDAQFHVCEQVLEGRARVTMVPVGHFGPGSSEEN